jgi:predicted esterase
MRVTVALFAGLLTVAPVAGGVAHRGSECMLFFKDGYFIQGWIEQDVEYGVEGGNVIKYARGTFQIQDGVRNIAFSNRQVRDAGKITTNYDKVVDLTPWRGRERMPAVRGVGEASGWKDFRGQYRRTVQVSTPVWQKEVTQRLSELNPHYLRLDCTSTNWDACYLSTEFGPKAILDILNQLPSLKASREKDPFGSRMRIVHFLVQARWYGTAAQELDQLAKDFPKPDDDQKRQINGTRESLARFQLASVYEQIERGYRAGRHAWVQKELEDFPADDAAANIQARITDLKGKYSTAAASLKQARHFLGVLPAQVKALPDRDLFRAAAEAILAEMSLDDFLPGYDPAKVRNLRLDDFIAQATSAERARGRAGQTPEQLLSLAVTAWLQGKELGDSNVATARRLWGGRQFVLEYLKTTGGADRAVLWEKYRERRSLALSGDEFAQLVRLMPPVEAAKYTGTEAQELLLPPMRGWKNGLPYLIQLPPEYHHGHAYPVVFALHGFEEKPKDMLDRLADAARDYGCILVAPEWSNSLSGSYAYTPSEHAAVCEVLRDLRRRFQVDSDHVFLVGAGDGATMAYDVGLSHPDLFAGIVPVSGRPEKWTYRYRHNAQYLPFYVVAGDKSGQCMVDNRKELEDMVRGGYPVLYIEYRGRGEEWFPGEVSYFFNWMEHQKRVRAVPRLGWHGHGDGQEFQTMRSADNHFYWVSCTPAERYCADEKTYNNILPAASVDGSVNPRNVIYVNTHGVKALTVWLDREMRLDLDKQLAVHVNNLRIVKAWAKPDGASLLEDFYARGDRQRLFVARVEIEKPER